MAPRHSPETIEAAVAAHRRGEKSPVICNRHGISERTLYRWIRSVKPHGGAGRGGVEGDGALYRAALHAVAAGLDGDERDRAVHEIRTTLQLNRDRAERLLGPAADPED